MKYTTLHFFRLGMVFLLAGCSARTEVNVDDSDDGILAKIEPIFGGKEIQSEAFIVLKSDEVRYMADREVIFFDDDIKASFNALLEEHKKGFFGEFSGWVGGSEEHLG
jgi:hypothetical protein